MSDLILLSQKLDHIDEQLNKIKSIIPILEMMDLEYALKEKNNELMAVLRIRLFWIKIYCVYAKGAINQP